MNKRNYIHCSDLHLNFLSEPEIKAFCSDVTKSKPDGVIITGDISEAPSLVNHLKLLEQEIQKPIYYVLGNHDYYRGSVSVVRNIVADKAHGKCSNLFYLPSIGRVPPVEESVKPAIVALTGNTCLVGHDGWYDGQYANWFAPGVVVMSDYMLIGEFRNSYMSGNSTGIYTQMQVLANECGLHIRKHVAEACKDFKTVIFATHIPPWPQNSVHRGRISDFRWLPNFSSKIAGDALIDVATAHPKNEFVVLCGHSHGSAHYCPLPNINSYTANSEYGSPEISIKELSVE